MPTLNWIGKDAVVTHHRDVPFRLLEPVPELSCPDPRAGAASGNLIVQGDNLHALKALLPRYAGQVKCIYIDPPYNTGNEGWDCPFAYILVSLASLSSATAIEQLLGRVLRQPDARQRRAPELNQSYAFVVSHNFAETAQALRDRLVSGAGFERRDVRELVAAAHPEQARLDLTGQAELLDYP